MPVTSHVQLQMFGGGGEFRERVRCLRLFHRWDQSQLGKLAGLNTATISQIETGRITPTAAQVSDIARAFACSQEFLTAELKLLPTTRPWLRAYADASRREAEARTAAATVAAEYVRRLNLTPLPDLLPLVAGDLDDDDVIEAAADEARQLAQIESDAVVANAIRAAERLGCVVLPLESELGRHLGMSVRSDQLPILFVARADVPGDRQRFTVAHELGHLILHWNQPPPRDAHEAGRMERQANRFAAAFLGPGDALLRTLEDFGGRVTLRSLADIKGVWGISIKSLVGRFSDLGVIDTDHSRSLYKQISARKWTKDEPVPVTLESAQWFERTLLLKTRSADVLEAANRLASTVGGNGRDLFQFVDWAQPQTAQILSLGGRARH